MRVTAFAKYSSMAASSRHRLLQYTPHLTACGIEVDFHALLPDAYVEGIGSGRRYPKGKMLLHYLHRFHQVIGRTKADLIWINAELFPFLPASFERLAFRSGNPVVYDFDDAFFNFYGDHRYRWVRRLLAGKLNPLLRGAALSCCGNTYLERHASRFTPNTMILPTVVDTSIYRPAAGVRPDHPLTLGWIGSPSTWAYMRPLLPLLRRLVAERGVRVRAVGAGAAARGDAFAGLDLIDWQEEREVEEIRSMDIGLMPLPDDEWARGKCGFKLIQYAACGLPVVASPVGANREIVLFERTGLFATSEAEWSMALLRLIDDPNLRSNLGGAGRRRIEEHYSLHVHAPRLVEALKSLGPGG